jgi:hydroxyacylglutathione hydrolase
MAAHPERTERASRLTVREFEQRRSELDGVQIVDIRNPGEIALGSVPGAVDIPVGQLPARLGELDASAPTVVYCAGGYRSSVAASLLRANGFTDVSDLLGGFGAWVEVTRAVV